MGAAMYHRQDSRKGGEGYCTRSTCPPFHQKRSYQLVVPNPAYVTLTESPVYIQNTTSQIMRKKNRGHA